MSEIPRDAVGVLPEGDEVFGGHATASKVPTRFPDRVRGSRRQVA
jgi:hypothetical protein